MSAKLGLVLPGDEFPNVKELKTLFTMKVRVSLTLKVLAANEKDDISIEGEEIEYHFIDIDDYIVCVYCKSIFGDVLGLCGLKCTFDEYLNFYNQTPIHKNNITLRKIRVSFFPYNWYACFESDVFTDKWTNVHSTLLSLKMLTEHSNVKKFQLDTQLSNLEKDINKL